MTITKIFLTFCFLDTTRSMHSGEVHGKDYYFVSRETMMEDIEAGKFIEYGEYKGNLYGTSVESVLALINAGYVCVMNPHFQVGFFLFENILNQFCFKNSCLKI